MAVNRVPVLKRCRALGLEPSYLGYDKKSNRTSARAGKKALCICTVSDSFVYPEENTTAEERQNSFTKMMEIALEIA